MELTLSVFVDHLDFAIGGKSACAPDVIDLVLFEEKLNPSGKLLRNLAGSSDYFVPIIGNPFDLETELVRTMRESVVELCIFEKSLGRDATPVEAGAPGPVVLDAGYFLSKLSGADCSDVSAGAATNDNEIV